MAVFLTGPLPPASCLLQHSEPSPYEMPSDFEGEDEEIDEDAAFTAEDEAKYAGWFAQSKGQLEEGSEGAELEDGEDYNTDDLSEEVGICCLCFADLQSSGPVLRYVRPRAKPRFCCACSR